MRLYSGAGDGSQTPTRTPDPDASRCGLPVSIHHATPRPGNQGPSHWHRRDAANDEKACAAGRVEMPRVRVNGVELHYVEVGGGDPVLMIMGFGGDHLAWGFQVPALSARYRVIAFDNRGAGQSSVPDVPYSTRMMADDAVGLLDALGIERAHVIGVSMGGMIAQEVALGHPRSRALAAAALHLRAAGRLHAGAHGGLAHDAGEDDAGRMAAHRCALALLAPDLRRAAGLHRDGDPDRPRQSPPVLADRISTPGRGRARPRRARPAARDSPTRPS